MTKENEDNDNRKPLLQGSQPTIIETISFPQAFIRISSLAIPVSLSYTFSFAVFLVGLLASRSNNDDDHTAAITLISTMMNALIIISISPLFSMSILASHRIGELRELSSTNMPQDELIQKKEKISTINTGGLLISAGTSAMVFPLMLFSKDLLSDVFQQDETVSAIAQNFLRVYGFSIFGIMVRISSEQMMFSFTKVKPAMIIGLINFSIGTLLAILFGLGGLGFRGIGLPGIALGYLIEAYLTACCYALYIARHPSFKEYHFFDFSRVNESLESAREILKIGLPIAFTFLNEMGTTLVISLFAGLLGTHEQAALAFVMEFIFFMLIPLAAFGQICCQEVSREIGAKKYENANRLAKYGLLTTLSFVTPLCLIVSADPVFLMSILNNHDSDIRATIKKLVPIMAMGVLLDTTRYNLLQQLRALRDINASTTISVGGLWLGLLIAGTLGLSTEMGIYGIGTGYTLGMMFSALGLFCRWTRLIKPDEIQRVNETPSEELSMKAWIAGFFKQCTERTFSNPETSYAPLQNP